jgi:hypothetical protein
MSSILKVDQIQLSNGNTPTAGDLGLNTTGSVLQVVQAQGNTGRQTYTATSFTDLVSASITPTSTNSKILVTASTSMTKTSSAYIHSEISRGGTTRVHQIDTQTGYISGSTSEVSVGSICGSGLDSPNTTSSVTYSLRAKIQGGSGSFLIDGQAVITLIEIAG